MTSLELILSEIPDKNQCPPRKVGRTGKAVGSRAKNGGVLGEEIFCPLAKKFLCQKMKIGYAPVLPKK